MNIELFAGEKIIFKQRPHILFLIFPLIGLFLFWLLIVYFLIGRLNDLFNLSLLPFEIKLSWVVFGFTIAIFFIACVIFLEWWCNKVYLTNLRVYRQRGIIGRNYISIWLEDVEDVSISYGILGRIFNWGQLRVQSAGTYGQLIFGGLPNPRIKKHQIEIQFLNYNRGTVAKRKKVDNSFGRG